MIPQLESPESLQRRLNTMSYSELLELEDKLHLAYENLAYNYVPATGNYNSFHMPDTQQVKWLSGKFVVISLFVVLFIIFANLIVKVFGNSQILNSVLDIFIYLFVALFALFISDLIWQKLFTPFIRTIIRGFIHYWPATLSVIFILKNFEF